MDKNNDNSFENMSYYELLQSIYKGTIDSKNLPKKIRQALVQILILRGQEQIQIAKILKVTDRTIRRDVEDVWEQNALYRDPEFTRRFAGEVRLRVTSFIQLLTHMAHSADAKMNDRILAVTQAWQSIKGLFETLQSLGYLPLDRRPAIAPDAKKGPDLPKSPVSKKMTRFEKREERVLKKIGSMSPIDREKLRVSLQKEIVELSKKQAGEEVKPSESKPETPPKKDGGDNPEAGPTALAT